MHCALTLPEVVDCILSHIYLQYRPCSSLLSGGHRSIAENEYNYLSNLFNFTRLDLVSWRFYNIAIRYLYKSISLPRYSHYRSSTAPPFQPITQWALPLNISESSVVTSITALNCSGHASAELNNFFLALIPRCPNLQELSIGNSVQFTDIPALPSLKLLEVRDS